MGREKYNKILKILMSIEKGKNDAMGGIIRIQKLIDQIVEEDIIKLYKEVLKNRK